jgi:hypothetical protein
VLYRDQRRRLGPRWRAIKVEHTGELLAEEIIGLEYDRDSHAVRRGDQRAEFGGSQEEARALGDSENDFVGPGRLEPEQNVGKAVVRSQFDSTDATIHHAVRLTRD